MMELIIPASLALKLTSALARHPLHEIGGVLVGEHVEGHRFALADLSVQVSGGTAAHFVRDPLNHQAFLHAFFERTGNDYLRYNYLGEWHSHIAAPAIPSREDRHTMQSIVETPEVNSDFGVLIVVRLMAPSTLDLSAMVFRAFGPTEPVDLTLDATDCQWLGQGHGSPPTPDHPSGDPPARRHHQDTAFEE